MTTPFVLSLVSLLIACVWFLVVSERSNGMLVLSRKLGEEIIIGDDIRIMVVDIRGDKVRLGITAPNAVPVHREEVFEAIQKEQKGGAEDSSD